MKHAWHVTVCSLPDYEELVAEIYVGDRFVALISEEEGPGSMVLELAGANDAGAVKVPLAVFEPALQRAKDELVRLRLGPRPDGRP